MIDHFLLHCPIARELWDLVFSMFGVVWVMPRGVLGVLQCWPRFSRRPAGAIWGLIPHCIMWSLWHERNSRCFEGCEQPIHDLKKSVLFTLSEWTAAQGLVSNSTLLDFLDICSFAL